MRILIAVVAIAVVSVAITQATASNQPAPQAPPGQGPQSLLDMNARGNAHTLAGARGPSGVRVSRVDDGTSTCVTDATGSGHCGPTAELNRGLGFGLEACTPTLAPGEVRIAGALPVDTDAVTAVTGDGRHWQATAVNGTVVFELPMSSVTAGPSVHLSWSGRSQAAHDLPVPGNLAGLRCG